MSLETILLDFMNKTAETLGRIEANQANTKEDIIEIKESTIKIPLIEIGLNNHLTAHSNLKRFFIWPISVTVITGTILSFLKWIIKVI